MNYKHSLLHLGALLLIAFSVSGVQPTIAANFDPDRIVVLMSIDGLANFYMSDPLAEMPTIHKLASEGAKAASMKASNPTVTWPNHTTLVTGVSPAKHGVVGNNYLDRATGDKVTLIWDPVFGKDDVVKVPTIYDLAKEAGLRTAGVRWPMTRNAHSIDWLTPDVGSDSVLLQSTTPKLLEEWKAAGIEYLRGTDDIKQAATRNLKESIAEDANWTQIFIKLVHEHRPQFALMHVVAVDHTEHSDGPRSPEAYEAIKAADDDVRLIWDELQKDYPGKATLVIVSDHGFSANKVEVRPNVVLKEAGLIEATGNRVTGGSVQIVPQGGSALVYILDDANRDQTAARVKKALSGVEGIASVIGSEEFPAYGIADPRRDPHAPDMVIFAKMNYFIGDTAAGSIPHDVKPERKGSHGHDANFPDLHAMFVAAGLGIKPGAQLGDIDNRDVAPTLAKLLGIEIPVAEGKALTDALTQ
jgi:predicted AlkP superfamily pyrophosphatase or phosphodiesterase